MFKDKKVLVTGGTGLNCLEVCDGIDTVFSLVGIKGSPAAVFCEDDVWKTFLSEHDRFPGWAKRIGELQVDAYRMEYGWNDMNIVRPANVYGPHDNFDPANAFVRGRS